MSIQNLYYDETPFLSIACRLVVVDVGNTFGYVTNREGYTTIFVEDTGSGISEDAQKHIFERFYKEDSFTQGAGLGLSICQTIVDRLHGSISVSSELGKGTRFEVVIPDANE